MNPSQLDALLGVRSEDEHLEFKAAEYHFSFEDLIQYCVALANERGGKIVLGVSNSPPRRVVGTRAFEVPEQTVASIHQRLQIKVTFDEVVHPDGRVLVFQVPSRPVAHPLSYKGCYWMRAGESLVPMSPDQIRKIVTEGDPDWSLQAAMAGCDSSTVIQLLDTQNYFDLLGIPYPESRETVLQRLVRERLILGEGGNWTITNLGAILFAKKLDAFDRLGRKAPRVIVYEGRNKLQTKSDKLGNRGYAVGFEGLVEFMNGLVPTNQVIEQAIRREIKMFPEIAIRELIANALIHQDFSETGTSVLIELYEDRLEISSPGRPFIPPDRFIDEHQSRNERLADLMRRLGICEVKGSGIDKVVHVAELFQLPAPDFREGDRRTTAVLFGHQQFEQMDRNDRIRACYQHCVLRYVTNAKMTNQSLRDRFRLHESKSATVSQVIAATVEAGKVRPSDPTQTSTRYRTYLPYWA